MAKKKKKILIATTGLYLMSVRFSCFHLITTATCGGVIINFI